jgi:hypothetical protein
LKALEFPDTIQEHSLSRSRVSDFDVAGPSIALRRNDQSTCANLDRLFESPEISPKSVYPRCPAARALDPCKPLNPCKTAPQPEHSRSPQAAKPLQNRSAARAPLDPASRQTLAKLLRSQSTSQNQMISAFVPADQFIQRKMTKWKNWDFKDKNL